MGHAGRVAAAEARRVRLLYSRDAIADLDRLRAFIAAHDPTAAARIVETRIERTARLADFPAMGRRLDESPKVLDIREFAFGDHVVRYLTTAETVIVLRVWHHLESRGPLG